ncbi:MAG: phage portal protein [Bacilli bacterium]
MIVFKIGRYIFKFGGVIIKTYGRTTILANFIEDDLINNSQDIINSNIINIIETYKPIHQKNKTETNYLADYYKGKQDVLNKKKETRPEINNKIIENWCYATVEFKMAFLLMNAIKYVKSNDKTNQEVSILNNYCKYEHKNTKDMTIYKNCLVSGRGYRYVQGDLINEEDEAPFSIINCDTDKTEVIYSSRMGHEQLCEIIEVSMQETVDDKQEEYTQYEIYTRKQKITINNKEDNYEVISVVPIVINEHLITEYYLNDERISLIEIGKDLFDAINLTESLDADDIEQFVNAIMVFTNAKVDEDDISLIRTLGAVSISSTEQKKASVELLQSRLNSQQTQEYYNRLLNSLLQILGIPVASSSGGQESGDTGKAKLTGQGFTSANIRIGNDKTMFEMCDMKSLKTIIKICRKIGNSQILKLKISDLDAKFQRDNEENMLVKTQALLNLYSCRIPKEFANAVINLFADPNAVTELQKEEIEKEEKELNVNKNMNDDINKQNNDIQDTLENDLQGN